MACPSLWHHIPLLQYTAPPLQVVFVRLRPHRLEMPSISIIQVSRHVGHANLTHRHMLSSSSTAEINSVLYRPNDTSALYIVERMQKSNQSIRAARAVSTRPQLVPSSDIENAHLITGQASFMQKLLILAQREPHALTRGGPPLLAVPFLHYLQHRGSSLDTRPV